MHRHWPSTHSEGWEASKVMISHDQLTNSSDDGRTAGDAVARIRGPLAGVNRLGVAFS
jgi:hypothetical protein